MVTEVLVKEGRDEIKNGLSEGAIKSALIQRWPLDDIEKVLDAEMKGNVVSEPKKKGIGMLGALVLTIIGVGLAIGLGFGGLKLYEYLRKTPVEKEMATDIKEETPVASAESVPYREVIPNGVLSETVYVNEKERFSIRPPKGWEVDTSGKLGAPVFFFGPQYEVDGKFQYRPSINIQTGLAQGHVLDGYKQFYIEDLKNRLKDFMLLEERKLILVGREALLIKMSFTQDEMKLKGEVLLMLNSLDTAFVTTGIDIEEHWSSVENVIETSLYTFNFL